MSKFPVTHIGEGTEQNPKIGQLFHDIDRNVIMSYHDTMFHSILPEGWVNVKDFGAKGDGVNDDTTAIQEALDTIDKQTDKFILYFPAGTYIVSATLNFNLSNENNKRLIVIGDGWNSIIKASSPFTGSDLIYIGSGVSNKQLIEFHHIFLHNPNSTVNINLIKFDSISFQKIINNCMLMNESSLKTNACLYFEGNNYGNYIYNNIIIGGSSNTCMGIAFNGSASHTSIMANIFPNALVGIIIPEGTEINILYNDFEGLDQGIRLDGRSLTEKQADGTDYITAQGTLQTSIISGNRFEVTGQYPIYISGFDAGTYYHRNIEISNNYFNHIADPNAYITLFRVRNIKIANNTFTSDAPTPGYVLTIVSSLANIIIENNHITNVQTTINGYSPYLQINDITLDQASAIPIWYNAFPAGDSLSRPTTAFTGMYYFDTDLNKLIVFNGTSWVNTDGSIL